MSLLDPRVATALNALTKGIPAETVGFTPNGAPGWQNALVAEVSAAAPGTHRQVFIHLLKARPDKAAIEAEVFTADRVRDIYNLPLTDTGNAEALAEIYGSQLRYDHRRLRWLVWTGTRWEPENAGELKRLAIESIRRRQMIALEMKDTEKRKEAVKWTLASENAQKLTNAAEIAKHLRPIADNGEHWDADGWLLGCTNGVLDLRTGTLRPGTPYDRITMTTGLDYDPAAACPRWDLFLNEIFNADQDLIEFIQRAVGYSLTGDTREQCLFLCWGGGANGKSTFLAVLRHVLTDYARNTPFSTFEQNRRDQNTNDIASLYGARLVTASETSEASRLNEARVKAITGGDPVTARFLFTEFFTYTPAYKIWLAMNHLPSITGTDEGIWRRIRLIPFTVSFKGKEEKDLTTKLESEKLGILAWAVRGALEWQRIGLSAPAAVVKATEEYRDDSDLVAQFLEECTIRNERASVKAGELYKEFTKWCDQYSYQPLNQNTFGRRMVERGEKSEKHSGSKWYHGIGLPVKNFMKGDVKDN